MFNFDNFFSKQKKKKKPKHLETMRLMDVFEKKEDTFVKDIMKDIFRNNNLERITKEKSGYKTSRCLCRCCSSIVNVIRMV